VPKALIETLKSQKYHIIGEHSAVKRCRWLYESLVNKRPCYKQKFYGIKSHRCIQMTPSLFHCTLRCLFCWRAQTGDLKISWDEGKLPHWDDPETIVEGCIKTQLKLISGYKGNPKTSDKLYEEASEPKHVAISLAGEPTLYPYLSDLVESFHKRGFTTFLVSNGTLPEALSKLNEEPTQLYISLCAPDEETFLQICRPQRKNLWKKLEETLTLLPSFRCRTVIRLTLARDLNLKHPEVYARLIEKAEPTFIEPKAYMHVGFSRLRLNFENMPTHEEIKAFAEKICNELGYNILNEALESRVVLLSKMKKPEEAAISHA
jgi:tRNA wybutosine-synthesizing protein 1